ncbi:MAG: hypothetical protein HYX81_03955 [Chloroflexi bacterium]|nr:hypothetical protein [Chloroflexota bacterium]
MKFLELAQKVLREGNLPMSVEEIWTYAEDKGYDALTTTRGKTPWRTIAAQIYVDIRDNVTSPFVKIDSKPRKFFLKDMVTREKLEAIKEREGVTVEAPSGVKYSERELHPLLTYYAYTYMRVYTKTVLHERSGKRSYAQWLHPDLVGVNFPIEEWQTEVLDFGLAMGNRLAKLYSFEIKRELTFANIREAFFQTVSNSSWANEAYLVAGSISQDPDFATELKRLTASFGIGIIKLDIKEPDSSDILFPARAKSELDWETLNKLCEENPDFKDFILRVRNDLSSKEVRKEKYDRLYSAEELRDKIKE